MTIPRFSRPTRQIVLMVLICGLVAAGAVLIWPRLEPVFMANPYLNGTIVVVFAVGVLACFFQVIQLFSSVAWLEQMADPAAAEPAGKPPRLLAAISGIARLRGARGLQITGPSARSVLDSVGARMEESRDFTRYVANLLIFLGLLGTFFGLATTIPAVVDTIRSLQPGEGEEGVAVFGRLMDGLEDQLGGMGTAFASSLLGLAGSLVVGLLELYAGHGQNRFYRQMEEWLASITRVGFAGGDGEGGIDQSAIATVLDHMVDQMDTLQSLFSQSEAQRVGTDARVSDLTVAVMGLIDKIGPAPVEATHRLAASQDRLSNAVENIREASGLDEESRMRLRSIDVQLLRLHQEIGTRRAVEIEALRADLGALTEALRDLTSAARPRPAPPRPTPGDPPTGR